MYQYHHCHTTQPLLLEQLKEWDIDISSGQINQIHAERLVHKLIPFNEIQWEDQAQVRDQIWTYYKKLKVYKNQPSAEAVEDLSSEFNDIFMQKTRFATLNQTLKRLFKNKEVLLLVLKRPEVPLHTNGSESDIRDYVKKKKVSVDTRSDEGRWCRDTFTSLKKTCQKIEVLFWKYLSDRLTEGIKNIPLLPDIIRQKITVPG